jgi:Undecaprenyl-phosphate galactose phosphotransferase WbaP
MSDIEMPSSSIAAQTSPENLGFSGFLPRSQASVSAPPTVISAWLVAGDILSGSIALSASAAFCAAVSGGPGSAWLAVHLPISLALLIAIYWKVGLYRPTTRSLIERFRLRLAAVLFFILNEILLMLYDGPVIGYLVLPFAAALALTFGLWVEHFIGRRMMREGLWGSPIAILGAGEESGALASMLAARPDLGLQPTGFVLEDASVSAAGSRCGDLPILGSIPTGMLTGSAPSLLAIPEGAAIPTDPGSIERLGFKSMLIVKNLGDIPTFSAQMRHLDRCTALEVTQLHSEPNALVKRAIDLAVTLPLAILAAPIIAVLVLLIKWNDPGPAFYGQVRVGRGGKPIRVLKLRTMYQDADRRLERMLAETPGAREEWERFFKVSNDPRILPGIGDFLRRSSLDELPQLWNVLRGDMSLVGPRPFPGYHMEAFGSRFRALRVSVPPGLTGLWQISARSEGDLGVQEMLDSYYIRHRSLWLDLYILLATLPAVLAGQGAK